MQVLSELIAGIRGAENGTANIYERATSTLATVYADYDGSVALPQPLSLDSYGGAEVYVDQEVDVRVQDVDGVTMRQFSPMGTSNSVEYVGPAFTGRRYSDALSGLNQPVTIQAILDLWETQNGAPDWKVELPGGSEVTVQQAVAGVAGIFFNVKDPTYGAVGDGVTDDTVAVQAAITAAGLVKGIVIFPAGTYRVTAKLTVGVGVSLWGIGAPGSTITMDHATEDTLEYPNIDVWFQEIRGLFITSAGANSGKFISLPSGSPRVALVNSIVGGSLHTGNTISVVAGFMNIERSMVAMYTSGGIDATTASELNIRDSYIVALSAAYTGTLVLMTSGTVSGSRISFIGMSSGAGVGLAFPALTTATISGNIMVASTGGTCIGMSAVVNFAGTQLVANGNIFTGTWTTTYSGFVIGTNNPLIQVQDREAFIRNVTDNTASVDLRGDIYGVVVLTRTAAGGATLLTSTVGPPGSFLKVIIYNNSGGALGGDFTTSTGFYSAMVITKPSNTKISVAHFRAAYAAGTGAWVPSAAPKTDF